MKTTFRANEAAAAEYSRAVSYLAGATLPQAQRANSKELLDKLIAAHGPVITAYPSWHPLLVGNETDDPVTHPGDAGFEGLDHTVLLRNAVITCPYNAEKVLASFAEIQARYNSDRSRFSLAGVAELSIEQLRGTLYHENAQPVLIKCDWCTPPESDGTIPARLATALLLERELPCWRTAQVGETWETMLPYILGQPHGGRSSLFINAVTGQLLKDLWRSLTATGVLGPIRA